jgi:DNA-binding transcriptional LysR family regulator
VAATPGFAMPFLVPELAGLAARHPGLDIELVADLRLASLARRQAELALRYGPVRDSELIAREVARIGFGFYADADWAARIAGGAAPAFVGFDAANTALPEAEWLARHFPRARIAFRANGHLAQAAAAAAGAGVALLPRYLGAAEAALAAVPLGPLPPARSLSLLALRPALAAPAVRAVRDHLVGRFAARDWLGGGQAG